MSWLDLLLALIRPRKPTPAPVEPPAQPDTDATDWVAEINRARIKAGIDWLPAASTAMQAAKYQSDYQLGRRRMGHDGPAGMKGVGDRLRAFGQPWTGCGEIVAECPTFAEAVQLWLESPGHRQIMLDPSWSRIGAAKSGPYATGVFFR